MAIEAVTTETDSGLTIKDYTTIRKALQDAYRAIFGSGLNLDASSPDGQLVDLFAYAYTELAQAIQTVVANMDVNTATGIFLDYLAGISGISRNTDETDTELRARMQAASFTGLATFDAMATYLRQYIGTDAGLGENASSKTITGFTPHSFAVYVPEDFTTDDIDPKDSDWVAIQADANREATAANYIAQKIWNCKPGGIASNGTLSGIAIDVAGNYHTVFYNQVQTLAFEVKVTITEYSEERLPADYESAIQNAVAAWALTEYTPGKDVIPGRIRTPIYENVQGVEDITVQVCPNGGTWTGSKCSVGPSTRATIAAEDVEVTLE